MITKLLNTIKSAPRKNKYRVLFPVEGKFGEHLSVLCNTTSIPFKQITPMEMTLKGRKFLMKGESSVDGNWEATFYNDSDFEILKYIYNWILLIHNNDIRDDYISFGLNALGLPSENDLRSFKNDLSETMNRINDLINNPLKVFEINRKPLYQKDIIIQQLDENGEKIFETILLGAFPIAISPLDFDSSSSDASTITITFAYSDVR